MRKARGALKIVRSAGGNVVKDELFGHAAAQQRNDLFTHLIARYVQQILLGQGNGKPQRLSARHDGDLMHRILRGQMVHRNGVPRFVIGGDPAVAFELHIAALFRTGNDLEHGGFQRLHRDERGVAVRGVERCLVEQVFQIRAGKAAGRARDRFQVDVLRKRLISGMDAEDLLTPLDIGQIDKHLTVETTGTQQRRIEDVLAVGRRKDDHAVRALKAVHLDQKLVERLLALVVSAAQTRTAPTTHGVDLVDEDDRGRILFRLIKEVAHAARADADIQLDKIGTGDRQKLHVCLARDGLGNERLAGARRADQQHALGNARAEPAEFVRLPQKVDDLLQLRLFLVCAGYVTEANLLFSGTDAHVCFAEVRHAVIAVRVEAGVEEEDQDAEQQESEKVGQNADVPRDLHLRYVVIGAERAVLTLLGDQLSQVVVKAIHAGKLMLHGRLSVVGGAQLQLQRAVLYGKRLYLPVVEEVAHRRVGHRQRPIQCEIIVDRYDQQNGKHNENYNAAFGMCVQDGSPSVIFSRVTRSASPCSARRSGRAPSPATANGCPSAVSTGSVSRSSRGILRSIIRRLIVLLPPESVNRSPVRRRRTHNSAVAILSYCMAKRYGVFLKFSGTGATR